MRWLIVVAAVSAAIVWGAFKFAPADLALVVALALCGAVAFAAGKRPEVVVVALVGAAALDITGRIATVGDANLTLYQGLVAVVFVFAAWRVRKGESKLVGTPVDLPVIAFLGIAVASIFVAPLPLVAVVQVISILSCAVLVYLIVVLIDTPARAETLVLGVLGLAALWSVGAYFEKHSLLHFGTLLINYGYGVRTKMTFKDPNIFGDFLAVSSAMALPLAFVAKSWLKRLAIVGGVALCLAAIFWTGSRGALAGFLIAAVVVVIALRIPLWQKVVFLAGAALLVAAGIAFFVDPLWIQNKVIGVWQDESWMDRVRIVQSALAMSHDHLIGVGAGNFSAIYPYYRDPLVRFDLVESHTMLATILVEYGVVGLGVFLWLLWRFLSRTALVVWREKAGRVQALATGVLAGGFAVIAQSFTYSLETSKYLWLTIGLGMALYGMSQVKSEKETQ